MGAVIVGTGKALPALEIMNNDMETLVETNDEWISSRTGIKSRRIAIEESSVALAYSASCAAMNKSNELHSDVESLGWTDPSLENIDPLSIDLVLYATVTSDTIVPSAAAALKKRMGLQNAIAFDINAACTGFIYILTVAESLMAASQPNVPGASGRNPIKRALICGVDRLSRITDWQDRNTCVLFGDGAGVAVLEWRDNEPGVISTFLKNDDDEKNCLTCPQSYESMQPFDNEGPVPWEASEASDECAMELTPDGASGRIEDALNISERLAEGAPRQVIRMEGQTVFKFATRAMVDAINEVLDRANMKLEDVSLIVPHQANERIIKFAAKKLDLPLEKFQLSIDHTGNTSSASVPMALAEAYSEGRIKKGDKIIIVAFGGGLTSGAALFEA